MNGANLGGDNEERFSLGGAAHDLSARASSRDPRRRVKNVLD
jgi:hypothetical protein